MLIDHIRNKYDWKHESQSLKCLWTVDKYKG